MELNGQNTLCNDPFVATYSNILSEDECQHFIDISKQSLKRALVSENNKGVISKGRTGLNTWINHNHDEITKNVGERIANIVNIPLENAEAFQVIYYGVSQEYREHYDSWEHNGSDKTLRCMKYGGARMKTALCYLNNVKKGGGTKMTKLDITVSAEKGRLLVFQNTISSDNHTRHPLSEHAGLPVEEGEKYAFNLWFKECNSKKRYEEYNPDYYKNKTDPETTIPNVSVKQLETVNLREIYVDRTFIDNQMCDKLIHLCRFNTNTRRDGWVGLDKVEELATKLEDLLKISRDYFENINVVEYKSGKIHNKHFIAYDIDSEKGQKYTKTLGQRLYTVSISLTDNIQIEFPTLNSNHILNKGDIMAYLNVKEHSIDRKQDLERTILNNNIKDGYIANVYIRQKNKKGDCLSEWNDLILTTSEPNIKLEISEIENYMETFETVMNDFRNSKIGMSWGGYKSFKYNFKGCFDTFKEYIHEYNRIRDNVSCVCLDNLEIDYRLDEKLPIQIVNNVLNKELLVLIQKYYKETIQNNIWMLGDRQSNRYKANNEPMSRFLHYEILPLVERIVGKSLKPTYTYLSAYVKGADLPPHTDRPDCEYTVSFIVDKPVDSNWNIYVHRPQQEVKHKGRYKIQPPLDECEAVDCGAGGLMLFQGTDHIHFRETLEYDYYNIVLLHYCVV